jgi:hypothetical protein
LATPVQIKDGTGKNTAACVSSVGQLVTAPFSYDLVVFKEFAEPNTAYNFYEPKHNKQFVITGIVLVADKQVSSNATADVVIYEASLSDTTTVDNVLYQTGMIQDQVQILLPLNILVNSGKFINGKTTDDDIHANVIGYYLPILNGG